MRGATASAGSGAGIMDITILNHDAGHLSVGGLKGDPVLGGIATLKAVKGEVGNAGVDGSDASRLRAATIDHWECACAIVAQRNLMTRTAMDSVQVQFFVPHITALEEDSIIWMQTGQHALHMADRAPG